MGGYGRAGKTPWPTVVVTALCAGWASVAAPQPDDCATACLQAVLTILGEPPAPGVIAGALKEQGEPPYSLLALKRATAKYGIALEGRSCTLAEALAHPSPVVLALRDPDHFVVALNQDGTSPQLLDGDRLGVGVPEQLANRFGGVALFTVPPRIEGPRVALVETHHEVGTVRPGQDVVETFVLRNEGAAPLAVSIASTVCCGMTAALDVDEIAPGGPAT